jgi:hypothetical protein
VTAVPYAATSLITPAISLQSTRIATTAFAPPDRPVAAVE